mmetsp:Transcript_71664/g.171138  ORF Transcript_71664/g.171138 Transcript_71664/m.171138 type:complete len:262 (-) Transcript_71664:34-819(-)
MVPVIEGDGELHQLVVLIAFLRHLALVQVDISLVGGMRLRARDEAEASGGGEALHAAQAPGLVRQPLGSRLLPLRSSRWIPSCRSLARQSGHSSWCHIFGRQPRQPVAIIGLRLPSAVHLHRKLHGLSQLRRIRQVVLVDEHVTPPILLRLLALDEAIAILHVEGLETANVVGNEFTVVGLVESTQTRLVVIQQLGMQIIRALRACPWHEGRGVHARHEGRGVHVEGAFRSLAFCFPIYYHLRLLNLPLWLLLCHCRDALR